MKPARLKRYLEAKELFKASPSALEKNQIQKNPDPHIDQDFEGYPNGQAKEELISPKTKNQKKTAAVHVKDGEKMNVTPAEKRQGQTGPVDDGSAGAFEGTEEVKE
jgi:hypothetical protein